MSASATHGGHNYTTFVNLRNSSNNTEHGAFSIFKSTVISTPALSNLTFDTPQSVF